MLCIKNFERTPNFNKASLIPLITPKISDFTSSPRPSSSTPFNFQKLTLFIDSHLMVGPNEETYEASLQSYISVSYCGVKLILIKSVRESQYFTVEVEDFIFFLVLKGRSREVLTQGRGIRSRNI